MGGKLTQAPATPELVERLKDAAERFLKWTYDQPYSGSPVISIPRHPNNIDAILCEAADALEAQQARIAELEKALTWIALLAETRGRDSDRTFANVARGAVQTIAEHSHLALSSSHGRHEGVTSGSIPELPGVNAVPLPASPDGPSQIDRVWAAVNVLGAPDTACTSDEDRAYCRAIGDALSEIEKLGGRPQ